MTNLMAKEEVQEVYQVQMGVLEAEEEVNLHGVIDHNSPVVQSGQQQDQCLKCNSIENKNK